MTTGTIWEQLTLTLKENQTLKKYIKVVFEGARSNIGKDSLPCIMLEPSGDNEILRQMNNIADLEFGIDIFAVSSNVVEEKSKTIVGDDNYKGITDIETDIRACLLSSYSLGNRVIDIKFEETLYDDAAGFTSKYPARALLLPIKIHYRQTNGY